MTIINSGTVVDDDRDGAVPSAFRLRWDVFLSFRGEDTRHGFTLKLYEALKDLGVRAFLDNDGLHRGDEIAPTLLEAIEDSAAAVVIFSPKYADSRWCLEELATIYGRRRTKLILPVFYDVDPSDVRRQRGVFGDGFRVVEQRFGEDCRVLRWKTALEKIGGFAGWVVSPGGDEAHVVKSVVNRVLNAIKQTPVSMCEYTVGIESSVEELVSLLDLGSSGVRVLGLYGMGGIGKTTLAKALFNKLVGRGFRLRSFISNVREVSSREDGLASLESRLMDDLSKDRDAMSNERKALVVLDDVDDVTQLNALILSKREKMFHGGSRIIVTTRDKEALPDHIVNVKYEVRELESDMALQLFSYHALRREKPTERLWNFSKEIVSLTGGLPLALEVFGSMLFDKRRIEEWKAALQKLKQIRPANLQDVLKISYDRLDEQEKCVFLDIACLFIRMEMKRDYAIDVLEGCGFDAEIAISDLTAKSLVKITSQNRFWMHDQVRDMGRQIVKQESIVDPCMRSRLWNRDEIVSVFLDDKKIKCTQGIVLDLKEKHIVSDVGGGEIAWHKLRRSPNLSNAINFVKESYKEYNENQVEKKRREVVIWAKVLGTMSSLRLLQVNYANLAGEFRFPEELKWLQWKGCPLKHFSPDICAHGLSILDLSESKFETFWRSNSNKVFENLKILNLSDCHYLNALPNLFGNKKLEKLFLRKCFSLKKLDETIGNINTLVHLDLELCSKLTKLPSDVSGWKCLKTLNVSGCSNLKELPKNIGTMKSLKQLLANETAIESLPDSIFHLTQLKKLSLSRCRLLKQLPCCIGKLCSLKELSLEGSGLEELPGSIESLENLEKLNLRWCSSLTQLPDCIGSLKLLTEFYISGCPIKELPYSVGFLPNLETLTIGNRKFLCALPSSLGRLGSLVALTITDSLISNLPDQLGGLKSLKMLELRECRSLESLPESIGSLLCLSSLTVDKAKIKCLPNSIGELENLTELTLAFCGELSTLPESIGNLKSLKFLSIDETSVKELPQSFGMLSSLMVFRASKIHPQVDSKMPMAFFPSSFSNLSLLNTLVAWERNITGDIPNDFEKLVSLEHLNLSFNNLSSLPTSLRGLSKLKELYLYNCNELKSLPPLPSSLVKVDVSNCIALEIISDVSNLEILECLDITNCEKVVDIPGLEHLKSLKRLCMSCCSTTCSLATKKRLTKGCLRKIRILSMPGSKIPDWFSQEVVTFKERKNRPFKNLIVIAVVSLDQTVQDDPGESLPGILDIGVQILKQDKLIASAFFDSSAVPSSSEDQILLYRYGIHDLVLLKLKEGDKITVTKASPPINKGIELKKWGVHLVYEGDDDYEGDEELLNESQLSISEKLSKFFRTFEEDDSVSRCNFKENREVKTHLISSKFGFSIITLSFVVVLFSWLLLAHMS